MKTHKNREHLPSGSILVSTYNRPAALSLCLQSIAKQTVLPDEVVIADDGSGEETVRLIEQMKLHFPVPLVHVWQEDKGFRLAKCRNKAVARSGGEYIIQIDGDLVLHRRFVEDHLSFARPGCFLKGGRVNLTGKLTDTLCRSCALPHIHFLTPGLIRRTNAIHCAPLSRYLAPRYQKNRIALGCNMSFWKKDYIAVNGYDEVFEGWGGEDSDFAGRMINRGLEKRHLKFAGIAYHLWHDDLYMQNREKNYNYLHQNLQEKRIWCDPGVNQYL
ncbi:MAG: glycosyltransferase family 2 protein [Tannerella sp.]|jgi:glycosyltransferase involved in cell wall biosynthesis|nr:glycosyltransferase family 2 protein [Tannerella sp.]